MDTSHIVSLIKKRDEKGLTYLFDYYSGALNGIIVRILKSDKLSEEVLQHTFLKIWDKIDSYNEDKSSLFTWMSRIARNSAIDARRLKTFENNQKTDSLDIGNHNKFTSEIKTSKIDVDSLTSYLEAKHQSVLYCVYLEGYSHKEASEILGIPLGTVKTRLRNAIKELRRLLKDEKAIFLNIGSFLITIMYSICL